ncbi:MAG: FtsX-like permease family protein [Acidobacteriota bacterium]
MKARTYWQLLKRESRGTRRQLLFFIACLAVGVTAVVSVAGLSAGLEAGIRTQSRSLLAADLALSGRRPLPPEAAQALSDPRIAERVEVKELATLVVTPEGNTVGGSQLVELKAVGDGYPFYGDLRTDPPRPLTELLTPDAAVVAPELLSRLGLDVGDPLRIGGEDFRIAGRLLAEPDRLQVGLALGPRVFVSLDGLARTSLVQKGSRVSHRTLLRLADSVADPAPLAETLDEVLPPYFRVETARQAQPSLRQGVSRVDRFLGLTALLSLLVGGLGIGQTIRAWLASRYDALAIFKCLGLRPREAFRLYLLQTGLLALAGSLVGLVAGTVLQRILPALFPDLIPAELIVPWQPAALVRGLGLGLGVALLFSIAPLTTVLRLPPARAFRRSAEPPPPSRWANALTALTLIAGITAFAALQARSLTLGAAFTGILLAAAALLAGAARLVTALVTRPSRARGAGGNPWLRHGLAALGRPGAGTRGAMVALGLGVLVVTTMAQVERQLGNRLTTQIPDDAPTVFLVDIQPDQWQEVQTVLSDAEARRLDSVPVVMGRLTAIDGEGIRLEEDIRPEDETEQESSRRWALTREQRLTYLDELPEDNRIVEGALWSDPNLDELSVEKEFADSLGVTVGSRLTFDIQGVPLDLTVTSLRTVQWETFGLNFFLVAEPGALADAPQQRVATVRLPEEREGAVQDRLAATFPNITVLRLGEILGKVAGLLRRIGLAVRLLGGFTVLTGLAILAGAIGAGAARRGGEVALLKTLGVTRLGVVARFAVEYSLIGAVAGLVGVTASALLAWGVLEQGFEIDAALQPALLIVAFGITVALSTLAGLAASVRALTVRPLAVLREG